MSNFEKMIIEKLEHLTSGMNEISKKQDILTEDIEEVKNNVQRNRGEIKSVKYEIKSLKHETRKGFEHLENLITKGAIKTVRNQVRIDNLEDQKGQSA